MTSQPGQQTVAIHLLYCLISHEVKVTGQLIEYNKRNVFLCRK